MSLKDSFMMKFACILAATISLAMIWFAMHYDKPDWRNPMALIATTVEKKKEPVIEVVETAPLIEVVKTAPTRKPGDLITNTLGMKFAWVPPGDSWLGGGGGKPGTTKFKLAQGVWCGIYPVTQAEWQQVMGDTPSKFKNNPRYPVESVSWNRVQEFLAKINKRGDGYAYRLPTEQEWEYTCRGGPISQDQSKYHYYFAKSKTDLTPNPTDNLSSREANFNGEYPAGSATKGPYLERPSDVGSYLPNPLGIYDMHGNVGEWTASSEGSARVIRGGSWITHAESCAASGRDWLGPGLSYNDVGFRLLAVPSS